MSCQSPRVTQQDSTLIFQGHEYRSTLIRHWSASPLCIVDMEFLVPEALSGKGSTHKVCAIVGRFVLCKVQRSILQNFTVFIHAIYPPNTFIVAMVLVKWNASSVIEGEFGIPPGQFPFNSPWPFLISQVNSESGSVSFHFWTIPLGPSTLSTLTHTLFRKTRAKLHSERKPHWRRS